ncbi:MAG TPA: hypothetical protein PKD55_09510 [Bellilinea sp.]|nr:hypothetical protein [Bellilinea sp.]
MFLQPRLDLYEFISIDGQWLFAENSLSKFQTFQNLAGMLVMTGKHSQDTGIFVLEGILLIRTGKLEAKPLGGIPCAQAAA